jgi:hypothetical protein
VTHVKLQRDDDQQARLHSMSTTLQDLILLQRSKALMHLQGYVLPQGPPHLHVHSLNPSVLKSSISLHTSNQATPSCLRLNALLRNVQCSSSSARCPPSQQPPFMCRLHGEVTKLHRSPMLQEKISCKHPYKV